MKSGDFEVLSAAADWLQSGQRAHLVTVVATWGSSPRPPGSMMAIGPRGEWVGSISGGCIEADLLTRLTGADGAQPLLLDYGVEREEARRFGLPCGGRLQLVVEPQPPLRSLLGTLEALNARQCVTRRVDLASGDAEVIAPGEGLHFDGRVLAKRFGPAWRLLLIGAGQLADLIGRMAPALDFHPLLCDPRVEAPESGPSDAVEFVPGMPDDAVAALADPRTAVVALSHDPRLDDLALLEALQSDAFYVGAIGSRATARARQGRLRTMELPDHALARLHSPVGLPIGSRTPAEIAVSILAELVAVRSGRQVRDSR